MPTEKCLLSHDKESPSQLVKENTFPNTCNDVPLSLYCAHLYSAGQTVHIFINGVFHKKQSYNALLFHCLYILRKYFLMYMNDSNGPNNRTEQMTVFLNMTVGNKEIGWMYTYQL